MYSTYPPLISNLNHWLYALLLLMLLVPLLMIMMMMMMMIEEEINVRDV